MLEITVNVDIIRMNTTRGSRYESIVDIREDGELLIGGAIVDNDMKMTDEQIADITIERVYIPLKTSETEVQE